MGYGSWGYGKGAYDPLGRSKGSGYKGGGGKRGPARAGKDEDDQEQVILMPAEAADLREFRPLPKSGRTGSQ